MKKIVFAIFFIFAFACSTISASAMNILEENQQYRLDLTDIFAKQRNINKKEIQYYKGKPDYLGTSKRKIKKDDEAKEKAEKKTEKKGVKFKLDEKNKQKLKEKEEELKQKPEPKKTEPEKPEYYPTQPKKPQTGDRHNADAE